MTRHGFSLVETIIALFVLSVALLGVAQAIGQAERFSGRVRARSKGVFDLRQAVARFHRTDTVCAVPSGNRRVGRATLSWAPGPAASTRMVTTVAEPPYQGALPESVASVVACP